MNSGSAAWGRDSGEKAKTGGAKEGVKVGSWETRNTTGKSKEWKEETYKSFQLTWEERF